MREQEQREIEAKELEQRLKEQKREATRVMVKESVMRDQEQAEKELVNECDSDANLPDTSSEEDGDEEGMGEGRGVKAQAEFEAWKVRELKRILRDREEIESYEAELAEIERRRKMTDAEREAENARLGTDDNQKKQKVAYNFMQKFYHKGAFFAGNDDEDGYKLTDQQKALLNRDYNMPTGEDKMDKSVLPAVMQRRRDQFGKKGASKWTHLTD